MKTLVAGAGVEPAVSSLWDLRDAVSPLRYVQFPLPKQGALLFFVRRSAYSHISKALPCIWFPRMDLHQQPVGINAFRLAHCSLVELLGHDEGFPPHN